MSITNNTNSTSNATPKQQATSVKLQPKGATYDLPPAIVGSSLKLFGFTLVQLGATGLAICVFVFYMIAVPFPSEFKFKIVFAVAFSLTTFGYLLLPFGGAAGRTGLEWTVALISWRRSHIPHFTIARPVQNWQQFKNFGQSQLSTIPNLTTLTAAVDIATTTTTSPVTAATNFTSSSSGVGVIKLGGSGGSSGNKATNKTPAIVTMGAGVADGGGGSDTPVFGS